MNNKSNRSRINQYYFTTSGHEGTILATIKKQSTTPAISKSNSDVTQILLHV